MCPMCVNCLFVRANEEAVYTRRARASEGWIRAPRVRTESPPAWSRDSRPSFIACSFARTKRRKNPPPPRLEDQESRIILTLRRACDAA